MTITFKQRVPPFPAERLEALSKVLADTNDGLTGSQIDHLLLNCNIPNPTPGITKWQRLYNAFVEFQNEHQVAIAIEIDVLPAEHELLALGEWGHLADRQFLHLLAVAGQPNAADDAPLGTLYQQEVSLKDGSSGGNGDLARFAIVDESGSTAVRRLSEQECEQP